MSSKLKDIKIDKNIKQRDNTTEYVLKMKKRRFPWWILLMLLPLLLLIKCKKDITVVCIDPDTKEPIVGMPVDMQYTAYFLWNSGALLDSRNINMTQETDSNGKTIFKDLTFSLYSYIFCHSTQVTFNAKNECYAAVDEQHNFHTTDSVRLDMNPRYEDLHVKLLDRDDGYPLPDGWIRFSVSANDVESTDSVKADASGVVTIPHVRFCSNVKLMTGSCYGYADTTKTGIPARYLIVADDSTALRLKPIKEKFTFFVKNKDTKQPIPDATCTVRLTNPTTKKTDTREVHTSTDGRGIAFYDNAFILSQLSIHAKKVHYKDGDLEGSHWTVDKFKLQDDDTRTVWLEPDPFAEEFQNVDSLTGKSIEGVKNEITVTTPAGKQNKFTETSNKNGIFTVSAEDGSKIEIISTKSPDYKQKTTIISSFGKKEIIRMAPETETFTFQTIDEDTGDLLPDCTLQVRGSESGPLKPQNSGNGEFKVMMLKKEKLSIVASKTDYLINDKTVRNASVNHLQDANNRVIPLKKKTTPPSPPPPPPPPPRENPPSPCDASSYGETGVDAGSRVQKSYNMGVTSGIFKFDYDTGPKCSDCIDIYNHEPDEDPFGNPQQYLVWSSGQITTYMQQTRTIKFNRGSVITIVVTTGPEDGSDYEYHISCPL